MVHHFNVTRRRVGAGAEGVGSRDHGPAADAGVSPRTSAEGFLAPHHPHGVSSRVGPRAPITNASERVVPMNGEQTAVPRQARSKRTSSHGRVRVALGET